MPKHTLYESIDDMLAPETLSQLTDKTVTDVQRKPKPAEWGGNSGSHLQLVEINGGECRFALKQMSIKWDHIMDGSNDHRGRAAQLWAHGVMDKLPSEAATPITACAKDGDGWAMLMPDIGSCLFSQGATFDHAQNEAFLEGLAAIHATFWEQCSLSDDQLGLNSLQEYFSWMSLDTQRRVADPSNLAHIVVDGWSKIHTVFDADVANTLRSLIENPRPLCEALTRYPHTLVHGDYWCPNLGLRTQTRQELLVQDWQMAAFAPPIIDLAWYLVTAIHPLTPGETINNEQALATVLPITREASIDIYKQALKRRLGDQFSEAWWQPQLELGLMVGFLRIAWIYPNMLANPNPQPKDLRPHWEAARDWWSERVRIGVQTPLNKLNKDNRRQNGKEVKPSMVSGRTAGGHDQTNRFCVA